MFLAARKYQGGVARSKRTWDEGPFLPSQDVSGRRGLCICEGWLMVTSSQATLQSAEGRSRTRL